MRRVTVLGALIVVGGLSIGLGSQQLNPAAVEATQIEVVKGNLYVIGGVPALMSLVGAIVAYSLVLTE